MYDKEKEKCIIQDAISLEDIYELSCGAITQISLKKVQTITAWLYLLCADTAHVQQGLSININNNWAS